MYHDRPSSNRWIWTMQWRCNDRCMFMTDTAQHIIIYYHFDSPYYLLLSFIFSLFSFLSVILLIFSVAFIVLSFYFLYYHRLSFTEDIRPWEFCQQLLPLVCLLVFLKCARWNALMRLILPNLVIQALGGIFINITMAWLGAWIWSRTGIWTWMISWLFFDFWLKHI